MSLVWKELLYLSFFGGMLPSQDQRVVYQQCFLIGYAICRLIAECFRQPDAHIGFIAFNWLTMGQLLSIPMLVAGLWLLRWAKR